MIPRLTEVFGLRETVEVLKKGGAVPSSQLPTALSNGIQDALNSSGQHLPYKGKPPEGSFFFLQGQELCLHVLSSPKPFNFRWQVFKGGRSSGDEGDFEMDLGDGEARTGNALPGHSEPDILADSGVWLPLFDSEVESWIKPKVRHLRSI